MVPDWCHILLDEPQLDYLFEVEMPPEAYYQAFRKWLGNPTNVPGDASFLLV